MKEVKYKKCDIKSKKSMSKLCNTEESCSCLYLFVVLDPHADGVDQDGDHDASVEVLALHDSPQLPPRLAPQVLASLLRTTAPMSPCTHLAFLALLLTTRMYPLPVRLLHSSLLCLIVYCTANWSRSISEGQGCGTLTAAVGGRGGAEGHGFSRCGMVRFIMVGTGGS